MRMAFSRSYHIVVCVHAITNHLSLFILKNSSFLPSSLSNPWINLFPKMIWYFPLTSLKWEIFERISNIWHSNRLNFSNSNWFLLSVRNSEKKIIHVCAVVTFDDALFRIFHIQFAWWYCGSSPRPISHLIMILRVFVLGKSRHSFGKNEKVYLQFEQSFVALQQTCCHHHQL